jgi:hypothetical protein
LTKPLTEMSTRKSLCKEKRGRRTNLTIAQLSKSRLSRKCGRLNVS